MKFFVTGIHGRLGRSFAALAVEQGHTVVGIDIFPENPEAKTKLPAGVKSEIGTYSDIPLLERLLPGCDAVIHTAGLHGGQLKTQGLQAFLRSNVEDVSVLMETAIRIGVRRFVLSSTMEVVVGVDWSANAISMQDETTPARPDTQYSCSRLLMEQMGQYISNRHNVSVISLRYMCLDDLPDIHDLNVRLLAHELSGRDTARAVLAAALRDGFRGEFLHIGPVTPLTNKDIIAAQVEPNTVIEKYWPGATEAMKAKGFAVKTKN
ncbi:MAG: NAD(P)-dependent oxidoreductase, partial [Chthoniobacterales bacterium]